MVRLKNPMVDIASAGPPPPRPRGLAASLGERAGDALRREVMHAGGAGRGRVLIVGAERADIAFALAETGRFVTLLDSDLERLKPLHEEVARGALASRLTLEARSYADVLFEAGTFESIVFLDPFPYLGSPAALFKKATRELRAGGRLLVLVVVSRGAPYPVVPPQRGITASPLDVPAPSGSALRLAALRDKVLYGAYRGLAWTRLLARDARERLRQGELSVPPWRGPDWQAIYDALSQQLVVTRVVPLALAAFELCELAAALPPAFGGALRRLVPHAVELDERLLTHAVARTLAPAVLVEASKERELGRVFATS